MKPLLFETTFYLYVTSFVALIKAKSVTFFEDEDRKGIFYSAEFEGLQCYNIPSYFDNKASSVDTFENCIIVYEDRDCQGRNVGLENTSKTQKYLNLDEFNINNKIISYRQCDILEVNENYCLGVDVWEEYNNPPDLKDVALKIKQNIIAWYPRICQFLWSPILRDRRRIYLNISEAKNGIVESSEDKIIADVNYYRSNPDDMGPIIYEIAHMVQNYPTLSRCPKWLTEAIADYPRRWFYENKTPEKPTGQFEDSSHSYFLRWIDEQWPNTIYQLNNACRDKTFDDGLLQRLTGKNQRQLWEEMQRVC